MSPITDNKIEELLGAQYWVIDILPKQVPKDSPGQYFAIEKYYLEKERFAGIKQKHIDLILKLNCYREISLSDETVVNPDPEHIAEEMRKRFLYVMLGDSMILSEPDDTCLTVFNPDDDLLRLLGTLAAGEGLYLWKPDQVIETDRLILRSFEERDVPAIYRLLSDEEVNTYLPWYPVKDMEEAKAFFETRMKGRKYFFAVCLKENDEPIGYIDVGEADSFDLGYALRKEYWHQGIITEAGRAVIELLREEGFAYITATHDRNNPKSGAVMQRLGMKYHYSYKEQWQPKDFPVIFRMYQLNLDGQKDRVYQKYWNMYPEHFVEKDL